MKKIILILFALCILPALAQSKTSIDVLRVYDGDSILAHIEESNSTFRIRLIDIDCYEGSKGDRAKNQARRFNLSEDEIIRGGNLAGDYLRDYLKDKKISFEFRGIDKYNRALGVLYADNQNVNELMLKNPYCYVY